MRKAYKSACFVEFQQRLVQKFTGGAKIRQLGAFLHQHSKPPGVIGENRKEKEKCDEIITRATLPFLKPDLLVRSGGEKGRTRLVGCFRAGVLVDYDDTAFRQFSFGAVNNKIPAAAARIIINFG